MNAFYLVDKVPSKYSLRHNVMSIILLILTMNLSKNKLLVSSKVNNIQKGKVTMFWIISRKIKRQKLETELKINSRTKICIFYWFYIGFCNIFFLKKLRRSFSLFILMCNGFWKGLNCPLSSKRNKHFIVSYNVYEL